MRYLHGIHFEKYSRIRACEACEMSLRTADRAIEFLVKNQCIEKRHGGRATPAKIRPLMSLPEFLARYTKMARYVPQNGALSGAFNLKEFKTEEKRKPPSVENLSYSARMQESLEAGGVGWGRPDWMARVLDTAQSLGAGPGVAGATLARLVRQERFRGRSEEYLLAAFRSELTALKARRAG